MADLRNYANITRSTGNLVRLRVATMSQQKSQDNSVFSEKRVSQWEALMRKFSEAHKEKCKTVSVDIPRVPRSIKQFPTGSQYEGTWDVLGMSGVGIYTFPNGVIYEGEFSDGMFHGVGELRYPSGVILKGKWYKGEMVERTLIFADGLQYSDTDWKYCQMPDRRFTIEYERGLQPAGQSYLTADQPTRKIPPGYYDTGDGFYDLKTKTIYKADEITTIVRSPSVLEQKWIIENCRTCPESEVGPRTDLYEEWSEPQVEPKQSPTPASSSRVPAPPRSHQYLNDDNEVQQEDFYNPNWKRKNQVPMQPVQSSDHERKHTYPD